MRLFFTLVSTLAGLALVAGGVMLFATAGQQRDRFADRAERAVDALQTADGKVNRVRQSLDDITALLGEMNGGLRAGARLTGQAKDVLSSADSAGKALARVLRLTAADLDLFATNIDAMVREHRLRETASRLREGSNHAESAFAAVNLMKPHVDDMQARLGAAADRVAALEAGLKPMVEALPAPGALAPEASPKVLLDALVSAAHLLAAVMILLGVSLFGVARANWKLS